MKLRTLKWTGVVPRACKGILVLSVLAIVALASLADSPIGLWVAVTPPEFEPGLRPLIERRQAEGFKVVVLETTNILSSEQLQQCDGTPLLARLKEIFEQSKAPEYLVLAGVTGAAAPTNDATLPVVPSLRGAIGRMKGEPSDSGYSFPEVDGIPTVAVGRLPARTIEELRAMVQKTLNFEDDIRPAAWRNRLVLILGNPGGGQFPELFMQQSLGTRLALLHPVWELRTVFNVASSPYYLPRPQDREAALGYLQEGELFSLYLGHSAAWGLGLDGRFMSRKDWADLHITQGQGPFFTVGCYACQSNRKGEGFGLAAFRNPAGPVAVIGASGESYSAPGRLAVDGLLSCLTRPPFPARLGDYWLAVQAGLARGKIDATTFTLLDMADGSGGKVPFPTQRLEHLEMWMLLGDPALRLPLVANDVSIEAADPVIPGKALVIKGLLPKRLIGAGVRITVERRLNSNPADLETVPPNSPENRQARERAFMANHQKANLFVLASTEAKVSGEGFAGLLPVPDKLPWEKLVCRVFATGSNEVGTGILTVAVKKN